MRISQGHIAAHQVNGAMADGERTALKRYTWDEVKKHRSSESLWIVVDGKVYDVTEFMDEHPGGEEVLMEHAGRDATEAFEDVGHSPDAKEIQKKYLIGVVEVQPKRPKARSGTGSESGSKSGGSSSWSTKGLIVLFLVLLVAYVYKNYTRLFAAEQKGQ